jgi:hypothetical protein
MFPKISVLKYTDDDVNCDKIAEKNITNTPSILLLQMGITKMAKEERTTTNLENFRIFKNLVC